MGQQTDARLTKWRDRAGITLPSEPELQVIRELKAKTVQLLEVLVREESGIRDGDGTWIGSDALAGTIEDVAETGQRLLNLSLWISMSGKGASSRAVGASDGPLF